jgi:hypothetical protein
MNQSTGKLWRLGLPILSLVALSGYLIVSSGSYGLGYPLDDAWIHLTYARNIVNFGQWMFLPGVVSGGSTSPLWTLLLTPAFIFQLQPILWTTFLGFLCLTCLGFLTRKFLEQQELKSYAVGFAFFILLEWHFVWAALSGMETLLQTVGNLAAAVVLFHGYQHKTNSWLWFLTGVLIGALVWIRPDSLTWMGPALVLTVASRFFLESRKSNVWLFLLVGFLIPFTGYLFFNHQVAGSIWPTTMYAKQAEYQAQLNIPFLSRYLQLFILPFIGSSILLLPGLVYLGVKSIRSKAIPILVVYLWWLGMVGLYAWKLPVSYQHGRYMIPIMIIPILCGLIGSAELVQSLRVSLVWKNRLVFGGISLLIGLQFAFYGLGANAYRQDVGVIESEMVQTAKWVAENIPADKNLAVHDIGAMGFYSRRNFVDLAGLINPEVIPFIRNEEQLAVFLDEKNMDYVIVFPNWYNNLLENKEILYTTNNSLSPSLGGGNMTIFCWKKCK